MLKTIVEKWSAKFLENKFPLSFYYACIDRLRDAQEPEIVRVNISYLLHWKDGKVRKNPHGEVKIDGVNYVLSNPKPNTYSDAKHAPILASQEFFQWIKIIREATNFCPSYVDEIFSKFSLWSTSSIVIRTYLLHILNPRVFPIFDQHVNRARKFLMGDYYDLPRNVKDLNEYIYYQSFWKDFAESLSINLERAELSEIKQVDNALWSLGKFISDHLNGKTPPLQPVPHTTTPSQKTAHHPHTGKKNDDTSSPKFKNLVLRYCQGMKQVEAMQLAANELSINLPPSYLQHPGSHIYRWRKQGYPK